MKTKREKISEIMEMAKGEVTPSNLEALRAVFRLADAYAVALGDDASPDIVAVRDSLGERLENYQNIKR